MCFKMATEKIISCILSLCNSAPTLGSSTRVPLTQTWRHFSAARRQFSDKKVNPMLNRKFGRERNWNVGFFFRRRNQVLILKLPNFDPTFDADLILRLFLFDSNFWKVFLSLNLTEKVTMQLSPRLGGVELGRICKCVIYRIEVCPPLRKTS